MSSSQYADRRRETEQRFLAMETVPGSSKRYASPSGSYELEVTRYEAGAASGACSRGIVSDLRSGKVLFDVKRNLASFWFNWVLRQDGEYLLCGEDYQGYNVIDLRRGINALTFPAEAFDGSGFCWGAAHPSPSGDLLAVEGCYWGGPDELVIYDFSVPLRSPLPEVARIGGILQAKHWIDDRVFAYTVESVVGEEQCTWGAAPK